MDAEQMTFSLDVGGSTPTSASLKIGGTLAVDRELKKGEMVGVRVIDADGQVVAQADGYVTAVGFKDTRDSDGNVSDTERTHTIRLDK